MNITDIIAISALVLSILNFIIDRRDKTTRLQIYLGTGTKELKNKKKFVDNGYVVEVVNQGQTKVIITDVTVIFLQKRKRVIEATTEKVETHQPIMRYGKKDELGYHFSSINHLDDLQSSLGGGENAIYWLPEGEVNYAIDSNPLSIFEPNVQVKLKACVRIATGKQYYSSIITHQRPRRKNKETVK